MPNGKFIARQQINDLERLTFAAQKEILEDREEYERWARENGYD